MRILVAIDDSDATARVVEFVNEFLQSPDHEVLAINVAQDLVAPPMMGWGAPYPWSYRATAPPSSIPHADEVLDRAHDAAEATVQHSGVHDASALTAHGDPAEAIADAAETHHVDLLVVGSNHKGWLSRLWSPSVSAELVKHAERPVLVVP